MPNPIAVARHWRSRTELARFTASVEDWYAKRMKADRKLQHASALRAIQTELLATAKKLSAFLGDGGGGVLDTYTACARADVATGWLHRVFAFFRDKLDQRDNTLFGPALRAADEVVWSSFRTFSRHDHPKELAPIPFIDSQYSPAAIRRDHSLASIVDRGSGFDFLRDYLQTLPLPILRLPITTINAPWSLVLIGHEAGHFVQPLVADGYVDRFAGMVAETAKGAGGSAADVGAWYRCAGEIFADWYSVGAMGPWALWAMAQFELAAENTMRRRREESGYPSAIVRLDLLRQLADDASPAGTTLGTAVLRTLGVPALDAPPDMTAEERRDRAIARAIAARLLKEPLGSLGPPVEMFNDAAAQPPGPEIARWSRVLTRDLGGQPKRLIEEARYIAAASACVAATTIIEDDAARETFASSLRDRTFATIDASAVEGTRSVPGDIVVNEPGDQLSSLLLGLDLPAEMTAT